MTQKGEQVTDKGVFYDGPFQSNHGLRVSFLKNTPPSYGLLPPDVLTKHLSYQMIFALKGDVYCMEADGETPFMVISNQQHNLIAVPDGLILKPGNENEAFEAVAIHLSESFLSRYLPETQPTFVRNLYLTPEISAILISLENSAHTGFCRRLFLESKVIELLALQISQFELTKNEELLILKKDDLDKMNEVREILISNIDQQLSLRTLAHMVGTNEFTLKKNFKAAFGNTVYGYLNQYKMEQAKAILIEGDTKVSEVSDKMGYKHATHFTNAFKKYFGYLPTKIKMSFLLLDPEICLSFFIVP